MQLRCKFRTALVQKATGLLRDVSSVIADLLSAPDIHMLCLATETPTCLDAETLTDAIYEVNWMFVHTYIEDIRLSRAYVHRRYMNSAGVEDIMKVDENMKTFFKNQKISIGWDWWRRQLFRGRCNEYEEANLKYFGQVETIMMAGFWWTLLTRFDQIKPPTRSHMQYAYSHGHPELIRRFEAKGLKTTKMCVQAALVHFNIATLDYAREHYPEFMRKLTPEWMLSHVSREDAIDWVMKNYGRPTKPVRTSFTQSSYYLPMSSKPLSEIFREKGIEMIF